MGEHSEQQRPEVHRVWEVCIENALMIARDATEQQQGGGAASGDGPAWGLSLRLGEVVAAAPYGSGSSSSVEMRQMRAVDAVVKTMGRLLWSHTATSGASSATSAGSATSSVGSSSATGEPFSFPLGFIADLLELRVSHDFEWPAKIDAERPTEDRAGYNPGWLSVDCLSAAGVPWAQRFEAYSWLLSAAAAERRPLSVLQHLAAAVVALVRAWTDAAKSPMAEQSQVREFVAAATVGGLASKLQEIDSALAVASMSEGLEADRSLRQAIAKLKEDVNAALRRLQGAAGGR